MGVAVIFPGQGVQVPGMGRLWRAHPSWSLVDRAESALGEPLAPLLLDAGEDVLTRTREAQLAVLLASLLAWQGVRDTAPAPVAFAGHSLGQVTALVAAGSLSLEDGVVLAARRADATQAAADRRPGRMAALMGATPAQAEEACACAAAAGDGAACWLANDNAPGQVVVAGTPAGLAATVTRAKELGVKRAVPLNVGGAFHTPLMAEASAALAPVLAAVAFRPPSAPVVSNADALPYGDGEGWVDRLADHLVRPVRWRESMVTLAGLGASTFVQVGPGAVLPGLVRRTLPDVAVRAVATPDEIVSLQELEEVA